MKLLNTGRPNCCQSMNVTKNAGILLIFLVSIAAVKSESIFSHLSANETEPIKVGLDEARAPLCGDDNDSRRCRWVGSKKNRLNKYCSLKNVNRNWEKCNLSCNRCCEDEPPSTPLSFTINGSEKKCDWLSKSLKRRQKFCKKESVSLLCPKSCGVCCEDDYSYRFKLASGVKKTCSFITKKRRKEFCTGKWKKNKKYCHASCGCEDLSGRGQVIQLPRSQCDTQTRELIVALNPLLLPGVADDFRDSCKKISSKNSLGWTESQYDCNYNSVTKPTRKKMY